MPDINAVIFDVGHVLLDWDRALLYRKFFDDKAELTHFLSEILPLAWHERHDAGEPLDDLLAERIALYPQYKSQILAYKQRWHETIPGPMPGSFEIVEALDRRGIALYAITNFGVDTWALTRPHYPIFDRFRDIIVSGAERRIKPDPAIYQLAIKRFKIEPARAIFIDNLPANVAAAQQQGMAGHIFTSADKLHAQLAQLSLL